MEGVIRKFHLRSISILHDVIIVKFMGEKKYFRKITKIRLAKSLD
jgi:hypothetical protein